MVLHARLSYLLYSYSSILIRSNTSLYRFKSFAKINETSKLREAGYNIYFVWKVFIYAQKGSMLLFIGFRHTNSRSCLNVVIRPCEANTFFFFGLKKKKSIF